MLFESQNFKEESYQELVKFLQLLRSDGVSCVWFDALCINQTDEKEINREIQQMGSYHERSLGCYVVQHGIGKGYGLLDGNIKGDCYWGRNEYATSIPRWFTRAWTLQEWVLPAKTTFILQELDHDVHWAVQKVLLTIKHVCACCHYDQFTLSWNLIEACKQHVDDQDGKVALQDLKVRNCTQKNNCHFQQIHQAEITLTDGTGSVQGPLLYFVDDLAYIFVVKVAIAIRMNDYLNHHGDQEYLTFMERLQLKMRLTNTDRWRSDVEASPEMISDLTLWEISLRFCTKEEDRILSILKVLGVEGLVQVRTGKGLYEQVIHLARTLLNMGKQEELLVRLCMVDGWGNERSGMSWAPTLEVKPNTRQEGISKLTYRTMDEYFRHFRCVANIKDIDDIMGSLLLETFVLSGHLISCDHRERDDDVYVFWDPPMAVWKDMVLQLDDGCSLLNLCACVTPVMPDVCLLKPAARWSNEQGIIVLMASGLYNRFNSLNCIRVWLVCMGEGHPLKHLRKPIEEHLLCGMAWKARRSFTQGWIHRHRFNFACISGNAHHHLHHRWIR